MISRIEIKNFKSIKELNLELKPINIFIGANGAGKSNFLGFFQLLKNILRKNLKNYIATQAGADNILHFGTKNSDYLSGLVEFNKINRYSFTLKPDIESGMFFENEYNSLFCESTHSDNYPSWRNKKIDSGNTESSLEKVDPNWIKPLKEYISSFDTFHFHDTSSTSKIKRICDITENQALNDDGSNLAAYLYAIQQIHPIEFKRIETVIHSVAPFFKSFDLKPDRFEPDHIRLEWRHQMHDDYYKANHLSDGTLRFIALTTLLLQPVTPNLIIIDEPELGLHPFAIAKIAGMIKSAASKGNQIFIATQSTDLISHFQPEDIITVDQKDGQSIFKHLDTEQLADWLGEYTIGELWKRNIIQGGQPK